MTIIHHPPEQHVSAVQLAGTSGAAVEAAPNPITRTPIFTAEAAVVLAAEQLEAFAESEEAAARAAVARDGYWRWSDEAADHHAAALAFRRRARAVLARGAA